MMKKGMEKKMDMTQTKAVSKEIERHKRLTNLFENIVEKFFFFCALISIISVIVITIYIFISGAPAIFEIGVGNFLFGTVWKPLENTFGILPMILASILGTIGALVIGVTVGIFTAIFLAEIAPKSVTKIFKPAIELLAGIPSVVYGFFGLIVIVPLLIDFFHLFNVQSPGNSLLAVMIILGIMILPTVISITETAIRAVPQSYKEGSLALGASHIHTIFKVTLPAAKSGILAAVILGTGRAIGETMAVILVAGNSPVMPKSISQSVRTMTANVAMEMGYAFGLHQEALFATGVVLFVFIMILNIILTSVVHKEAK